MVKSGAETQGADGRPEAPAQVSKPLDEVGSKPEVVSAKLPVVLAFTRTRIRECLANRIDELVFFHLFIKLESVKQHPWVLQPERVIRDRLDFVSGFQNPTFAPGVDDSIGRRRLGNEVEGDFENDGINVPARLRVFPAIHKAEIAVLIFQEFVAIPR